MFQRLMEKLTTQAQHYSNITNIINISLDQMETVNWLSCNQWKKKKTAKKI